MAPCTSVVLTGSESRCIRVDYGDLKAVLWTGFTRRGQREEGLWLVSLATQEVPIQVT